ncbi:aspartate aminotransferase family protein [Chelativorans sp. Marseille-P2723]|uniref:aspartate aminotransferase family protein n=1 Tax=Chelativorans sp. Marseille-P2723 TaxID=2709133 RepID=UPI00156DDE80|nr:aspartate aminotransferase family protein [Chelativorans sp. Marseille-P2723]
MTAVTKSNVIGAAALAEPPLTQATRPALLSVEDAKALNVEQMADLFKAHINPGQFHFMKLLGFHKVKVERAEGMYYIDQHGRKILDFFGGFGSLAFGHNHSRILEARRRFQDEKRHEIAIAFLSQYSTALAQNLARCSPGDLEMVFFGSSGSEVMEAAVKLAERAAGRKRPKIVYAENSFHGKTKGVLAVTDGSLYRGEFLLTGNTVRVPFGDIEAVENAFRADPEIGAIVLETIQGGGGIIEADPAFWPKLRELCDRYGVIWVADEVQCGYGRTGRFYAFEHYGVVPDITALAKSLGAGKAAIGAMIARRDIYLKAYGTPKSAMVHAMATFGGIGEACVTAIEGLNVLYDEQLMQNAAETGGYLIERLMALQEKYPRIIKEVRGRGCMVGLEFHDFSHTMPAVVRPMLSMLDDKLKGSLSGFVGALLLRDHGVLVAFTEYNRNVIRLEPPLIVRRKHVDQFIAALDELLGRGVVAIVKDFVKSQVS